ncbi:MAG: hypothetical protein U0228_09995 [Myxococcaceae bacterium]
MLIRCLAPLLCLVALAACNRPCAHRETLTGLDGGSVPCVQHADCPRPSSTLVCGMTEDQTRECIGCEQNTCVHWVPGACP